MKIHHLLLAILLLSQCTPARRTATDDGLYKSLAAKRVLLPNQWSLTPAGQVHRQLGDLPLQIALSPDGSLMAVTCNGVGKQKLQLFRTSSDAVQLSEVEIPKAWYGLAISKDNKAVRLRGGGKTSQPRCHLQD